ncbi:MAG: hypothetical protein CSA62_04165 [Planctomycetota bacterium]|nr:MAG: hypothetical protein CSA62_04165 [Planctomycetota bacterium]
MSQLNLVLVLATFALTPLLFFVQSPRVALRNYLWLLPFLPDYIVTDLGVKISAMRAATLVLLFALLHRDARIFRPRWNLMDFAVFSWIFCYLLAVVPSPPIGEGIVFGLGVLVETLVPYLIFRAVVQNVEDLRELLSSLWKLPYLVLLLAMIQSTTGWNLFDSLKSAGLFGNYHAGMQRLGLVRADVGLTHYIMLGFWFAYQLPIAIGHLAGLGYDFGRILVRVLHLPAGAFFSLSGGSFLVALMGGGGFAVFNLRKIWPVLLLLAISLIAYVEVFSNRGFLRVVASYSATDANSAYYRTQLPAAVYEKMPGYWILGHGRHKPPMGQYNDITNNYLFYLLHGGLLTVGSFLFCFVVAINRVYRCAKTALSRYLAMLSWGVGVSLAALGLGLITVTLFGQMHTYLLLLFAMSASMLEAARLESEAFRRLMPGCESRVGWEQGLASGGQQA